MNEIVGTIDDGNALQGTVNYQDGGTGGTSNYLDLLNKPSINNIELQGNKTLEELGIQHRGNYTTNEQVEEILKSAKEYTDKELATFDFIKIVDALPEVGLPNRLYFVPKADTQTQDLFDEYAWINDKWEWITTKQIEVDLTNCLKKDEVEGKELLITHEDTSTETWRLVVYK